MVMWFFGTELEDYKRRILEILVGRVLAKFCGQMAAPRAMLLNS
jgi:hypothetical protein